MRLLTAVVLALLGAPAYAESGPAGVAAAVNSFLGLRTSSLQRVDVEAGPDGRVTARILIAGEVWTLELSSHSVRAETYEVRAQQADGSWLTVAPQPVRTVRGRVAGVGGSVVVGSRLHDGLYAKIRLPDDRQYWMEPVAGRVPGVAGLAANLYAVYERTDVLPTGGSCAVTASTPLAPLSAPPSASGGACVAELAFDADVEFYEDHNESVAQVEARINLVVNLVNDQFQNETGISHVITTILVRMEEPDPYTFTAPAALLDQFRVHWDQNHGGVPRDAAQLFTGKDLDGPIVGTAYLAALCGNLAYSVVESDFSGFACATDLSAHELGHNWGASHCPCQLPPYTMNHVIQCANRFHPVFTLPAIEQFRNLQTCVDCKPTIAFSAPGGLPAIVPPWGGTTVQVMIEAGFSQPVPGTSQLNVIINGAPFVSFPMTEVGPDLFEAVFPPLECADVIGYFFSVETTEQVVVRWPVTAPVDHFRALAGDQVEVRFLDDFEADQLWTVTDSRDLDAGTWERAVPVPITFCDRGNVDGDADGSSRCYVTDDDLIDCDSDVDDGSTTLTSPIMDASGQGIAVVSYSRWYDNTGSGMGRNQFEDIFPIEVSDDGGASWSPLETVGPVGAVIGSWSAKIFKIIDVGIGQTDQFQIRFTAQDLDGDSIVEAGVDDVRLRMVICCLWDIDGDLIVGITDFLSLLEQWDTDPGGPPDFDGDGTVGITDFLELLANWGPCS